MSGWGSSQQAMLMAGYKLFGYMLLPSGHWIVLEIRY